MTAIGYRPYPLQSEVEAAVGGAAPAHVRPPPGPIGELPVLVTADWCAFTVQAARFWQNAAASLGVSLRVLDAESNEGARVMDAAQVTGVPCAIAGIGRRAYGYQYTLLEAQGFLTGAAAGSKGRPT